MKKIILTLLSITALLNAPLTPAQTPPKPATTAASGKPVSAADAKIQELGGFIYDCATAKPVLGWKSMTISLDRAVGGGMNVSGYAQAAGTDGLRKLELCNKEKMAQALIDMNNIFYKDKPVNWQSLWYRAEPNRQFEFIAFTLDEVLQMNKANNTKAK